MPKTNTAPCSAYDWNPNQRRRKNYSEFNYADPLYRRGRARRESPEKYKQALDLVHTLWARRCRSEEIPLDVLLRLQIDRWKADTRHWSSVTRMIAHPSYLRIVGLARYSNYNDVERTLLRELETEPDHWFAALTALTGEDPTQPEYDFDESVNAWLEWGREKGII